MSGQPEPASQVGSGRMVCPACGQEQTAASFCGFCYQRQSPPLSGPQDLPTALEPPTSLEPPAPRRGLRETLYQAGALITREIYFESGVTALRLGLGLLAAGALALILLQASVALTAFWHWALIAAGCAAWTTARLHRLHAHPLGNASYTGSLDLSGFGQRSKAALNLWLLLSLLGLSALLLLNLLTGLIPVSHETQVLGTWVGSGKSHPRMVSLSPWPGHRAPIQFSLPRRDWERLRAGTPMRVTTHRGLLGIEIRSAYEILD